MDENVQSWKNAGEDLGYLFGQTGDGMISGMRYFLCDDGHAVFVRKDRVELDLEADNQIRTKAVVKLQSCVRRHLAQKLVRSKLAVHAWNILDANVENNGIRRGNFDIDCLLPPLSSFN